LPTSVVPALGEGSTTLCATSTGNYYSRLVVCRPSNESSRRSGNFFEREHCLAPFFNLESKKVGRKSSIHVHSFLIVVGLLLYLFPSLRRYNEKRRQIVRSVQKHDRFFEVKERLNNAETKIEIRHFYYLNSHDSIPTKFPMPHLDSPPHGTRFPFMQWHYGSYVRIFCTRNPSEVRLPICLISYKIMRTDHTMVRIIM
jgi:hypothetical protein